MLLYVYKVKCSFQVSGSNTFRYGVRCQVDIRKHKSSDRFDCRMFNSQSTKHVWHRERGRECLLQ